MSAFQREHPYEVEEGAVAAWVDKGVRPAGRILELLAAGELEHKGERLPRTVVKEATFRSWVRKEEQRRSGHVDSPLAKMPHRDAIEWVRIELLGMAHREIVKEKRRAKPDLKRLQDCARLAREAAAIPDKNDPRPAAPGQRDPRTGEHNGSRTKGALAAQIEAAHKRSAQQGGRTENGSAAHDAAPSAEQDETVQTEGLPGVQHGSQVAGVLG